MANLTKQRLLATLRNGNFIESLEAGRNLFMNYKVVPVWEIVEILRHAPDVHNRAAAAYTLSWLYHRQPRYDSKLAVAALLEAFSKPGEHEEVRAQALEGFALQTPKRGTVLWLRVKKAILAALDEDSVEIRFWACYAAGNTRLPSALPLLRELAENDTRIYRGWWRVSEEAADAIEWVYGRPTEPRIPLPISEEQ